MFLYILYNMTNYYVVMTFSINYLHETNEFVLLLHRVLVPVHKIETLTNSGLLFSQLYTSIKSSKESKGSIKRDKAKENGNEEISRTNTKDISIELPVKPRKPQSPYFFFLAERLQELVKSNTKLTSADLIKRCALEWESLDELQRKKFRDEYKLALNEYISNFIEYKKMLTDEQKESLKNVSEEIRRKKLLIEKRRVSIIYN